MRARYRKVMRMLCTALFGVSTQTDQSAGDFLHLMLFRAFPPGGESCADTFTARGTARGQSEEAPGATRRGEQGVCGHICVRLPSIYV